MLKKTGLSLLSLGVALSLVATTARAENFDFVAYASGNEHGAITETFTEGALSVTATARSLDNQFTYFMYLDDLSGGSPGGLGACKGLYPSGECFLGDDDNVSIAEVLVLTFSEPVTVEEILFSNGNHEDNYNGFFGVAIDTLPLAAGDFVLYPAAAVFNGALNGTVFNFISNSSLTGSDAVEDEIYISSLTARSTRIPEPFTLALLGFGLAPLLKRRRA